MEKEMAKYRHLEYAFQKIRTSTGNSDVQEMVTKFLTREQTYAQLLTAVNENEKKLELLRVENDKKTEILNELKIDCNQSEEINKCADSQEILQLHSEIQHLEKDLGHIQERKKNIGLVFDQVTGWTGKVANKINLLVLNEQG